MARICDLSNQHMSETCNGSGNDKKDACADGGKDTSVDNRHSFLAFAQTLTLEDFSALMTAVVEEARSAGSKGKTNESGGGNTEQEEGYIYNDDVFAQRFDLNRLKDIVRQHRQAKEAGTETEEAAAAQKQSSKI